jgi:predicted phage tail component-like protein
MMQDYIGFTYNGKHSIKDLKIYRTSSGRYDDNITATMTDKTVDVPGGDGQYYFGTTFKNRTFTVAYAFDNLTESDIRLIKQTFSGDGIHELVFDERPYKAWSAKVTGTASMKHLCFEENGQRIYKGEGSITFTCYYPFAHSPTKLWQWNLEKGGKLEYTTSDGKWLNSYDS